MSDLQNLQEKFQNYLTHAETSIDRFIVSTEKVPTTVRLAIYGNAYRSRLLDALADSYPALHVVLGDEEFKKLGNDFMDKHPSCYRSIRWFGDQLPDFLSTHTVYQQRPYLAELAQVEWTSSLVFDAADQQIIQLSEVAAIHPDRWMNMKLHVHPSTHRLNLLWNVVPLWQAATQGNELPALEQSSYPVSWIFWRKELVNQFCSLPVDEACAIDTLLKNATFGEICEGLCEWYSEENAALQAASLLKGWIMAGLISKIEY